MTRAERIAALPPESEYSGEALIVRRLYAAGKSLRVIASQRGYSTTKAYRLLNPEYAEIDRAASRTYKRENADAVREAHRAWCEANSKTCSECGEPMGGGSASWAKGDTCKSCISAERQRKDDLAVKMWHEGASFREIAEAIGVTLGTFNGPMSNRLRREGRIGHRRPSFAARYAA